MKIGQTEVRVNLQGLGEFLESLIRLAYGYMQTDRPGIVERHEGVQLQSPFHFPDGLVKPPSIQIKPRAVAMRELISRIKGKHSIETPAGGIPIPLIPECQQGRDGMGLSKLFI
jgi:hypothetical protein